MSEHQEEPASDELLGNVAIDQEQERILKEELELSQEETATVNAEPEDDAEGEDDADDEPPADQEHPSFEELPSPDEEVVA